MPQEPLIYSRNRRIRTRLSAKFVYKIVYRAWTGGKFNVLIKVEISLPLPATTANMSILSSLLPSHQLPKGHSGDFVS
jgi:hypothetical protein